MAAMRQAGDRPGIVPAAGHGSPDGVGILFGGSLCWIVFVFMIAAFADLLPLPDPGEMEWGNLSVQPGTGLRHSEAAGSFHLFGTDPMGRDILARLVYGARVSLAVGLIAPFFGLLTGGGLGVIAGYYRGRWGACIMACMDVVLSFPWLVLVIALSFYLGPGLANVIVVLSILTVPSFARIARANTMAFAGRDFVQAARMAGQADLSIIVFEILPNIVVPISTYGLLVVSYMIIAEGALSFLGLGVPSSMPSWGGMIAEGREVLEESVHVSLIPSMVMFFTVLSFNLLGDALRSKWDSERGQL